jgi:hypothetical protein
LREFFRFPDPVNEVAARLVATGVVVMAIVTVASPWTWLVSVMAFGFVARVLTGPRFSPLAMLVTRVIVPRLPWDERPTPGPPKRFAQGVGAVLTVTACVLLFVLDWAVAAKLLVAAVLVAASLEAFAGFCLGCWMFRRLMRVGLIPESVCEACADIRKRPAAGAAVQ